MSYESKEQIFLYHAYALGAGGYVERQGEHLAIAGSAPGALSIVGGRSVSTFGPWVWKPPFDPEPDKGGFRVSIEETSIALWTEETDKEWITNGEVTLSGFNLCDRLKIGQVVGKLTSRHRKNTQNEQAHISFRGSQFFNVFLDGERLDVTIDQPLDEF